MHTLQIREQQPFGFGCDVYLLGDITTPPRDRVRVYSTGDSHQCSCDYFKDHEDCAHVKFVRDYESGLDGSCCPIDAEDEF
jgi:hypothetical protein